MTGRCGTYAEYQAHRRRGEPTCEECLDASRRYQRRRRQALTSCTTYPWPLRALPEDMTSLGAVIARSIRESA